MLNDVSLVGSVLQNRVVEVFLSRLNSNSNTFRRLIFWAFNIIFYTSNQNTELQNYFIEKILNANIASYIKEHAKKVIWSTVEELSEFLRFLVFFSRTNRVNLAALLVDEKNNFLMRMTNFVKQEELSALTAELLSNLLHLSTVNPSEADEIALRTLILDEDMLGDLVKVCCLSTSKATKYYFWAIRAILIKNVNSDIIARTEPIVPFMLSIEMIIGEQPEEEQISLLICMSSIMNILFFTQDQNDLLNTEFPKVLRVLAVRLSRLPLETLMESEFNYEFLFCMSVFCQLKGMNINVNEL